MTLDALPLNTRARIASIDWERLAPEEVKRLRALGIDTGAEIEVAHRGLFAGRDPLAVVIGRMTIAMRRAHAMAMTVEELPTDPRVKQ
jgi:ferrous iron transport protein A